MAGIERGGHGPMRWPAEFGDVDDDARLETDDQPIGEEGDTGKLGMVGVDRDRLDALPQHERDPDDSFGAGLMRSGAVVEEHGTDVAEEQPVPAEERGDRTRDDMGLPPGS